MGRGGSPESASLECAGAWRLPVSPWSGKVSGGAASATRSHGGARMGAGCRSGCRRGPLKRRPPSPLAPRLRRPRAPAVPAPRSARSPQAGARRPHGRPEPLRAGGRARRAGRAPCARSSRPRVQAPWPCVLAPLPASFWPRPFIHPSLPQCSRSRPERKGPRPRRTKPKGSESSRTPASRPLRLLGDLLLLLPGVARFGRTRSFGLLPPYPLTPTPTPPRHMVSPCGRELGLQARSAAKTREPGRAVGVCTPQLHRGGPKCGPAAGAANHYPAVGELWSPSLVPQQRLLQLASDVLPRATPSGRC